MGCTRSVKVTSTTYFSGEPIRLPYLGLVTSCCCHQAACWRPACCWIGCGSMSIGDPCKSQFGSGVLKTPEQVHPLLKAFQPGNSLTRLHMCCSDRALSLDHKVKGLDLAHASYSQFNKMYKGAKSLKKDFDNTLFVLKLKCCWTSVLCGDCFENHHRTSLSSKA